MLNLSLHNRYPEMADLVDLPFDDPAHATSDPQLSKLPLPTAKPTTRRIFTVTELTSEVRELLETTYGEIWIDGELSNYRRWRTGHVYFRIPVVQ